VDRDSLIREVRQLAQRLQSRTVSKRSFIRETGLTERQILSVFESWNSLVEAAGLTPTDPAPIGDNALFEEMRQVFIRLEGVSTKLRFERECQYSFKPYRKRWGGTWRAVLWNFREWLLETGGDFPYVESLPECADAPRQNEKGIPTGNRTSWPATGSRKYGPVINFRVLQHAPVNEQGVVFLFGVVAQELGFTVESVAQGYPDCEAKRVVAGAGQRMERVRIEFEYRSRHFIEHGHDPLKCDMIVCWEHNWPECPLEVLELKSTIRRLPA